VKTLQILITQIRKPKVLAMLFLVGIIGFGIFFRVYNLDYPQKEVFDEVYFPKMAIQYLSGTDVFDVHPPFGKFIIASAIWLFGNTYAVWRIMPLIAGLLIPGLMGLIAYRLFRSRSAAFAVGAMVLIDGIFIAYSRVGLMDGILFLFQFIVFGMAIRWRQDWWYGIIWAIVFGLSIAIKWPAAAMFAPVLWMAIQQKRGMNLIFVLPIALVVYLSVVAAGEYFDGARHVGDAVANWHSQALSYHENLKDGHPWSSPAWSWPLMARPVLFIYDAVGSGTSQIITTLGNPYLWWGSTIAMITALGAVIWGVIKNGVRVGMRHPLIPVVIGYAATWLPWLAIGRVLFLYHYFASYGFALLALAYFVSQGWRARPYLVLMLGLVVMSISVYFLPFAVGWIPLDKNGIQGRTWVADWLSAASPLSPKTAQ
jgi:dolichyl-phosphate-mannose-protein mannosyltransferase